jgi:hypothetical protein
MYASTSKKRVGWHISPNRAVSVCTVNNCKPEAHSGTANDPIGAVRVGPNSNRLLRILAAHCQVQHHALKLHEIIDIANVLPEDLGRWERDAVAAIIEKRPSSRPLCRGRPGMERGYAMPTELERHLPGFGDMQQCPVMKAAMDLHGHHDQGLRNAGEFDHRAAAMRRWEPWAQSTGPRTAAVSDAHLAMPATATRAASCGA